MASTAMNVILVILALIIGVGVTYFGTSLLPEIDETIRIVLAIVISIFAFMALYFMTKIRG